MFWKPLSIRSCKKKKRSIKYLADIRTESSLIFAQAYRCIAIALGDIAPKLEQSLVSGAAQNPLCVRPAAVGNLPVERPRPRAAIRGEVGEVRLVRVPGVLFGDVSPEGGRVLEGHGHVAVPALEAQAARARFLSAAANLSQLVLQLGLLRPQSDQGRRLRGSLLVGGNVFDAGLPRNGTERGKQGLLRPDSSGLGPVDCYGARWRFRNRHVDQRRLLCGLQGDAKNERSSVQVPIK